MYQTVVAVLVVFTLIPPVAAQVRNPTPIVLTFEGLQGMEEISDYYNGGWGGSGSGPGPNYGITFDSDSWALTTEFAGGPGHFDNNPSGYATAFSLNGPNMVMNVAAGFADGISFFYSSPNYRGTVTVWSGQHGTGDLLATLPLSRTFSCSSDPQWCVFEPQGIAFEGTAESVMFSGTSNQTLFDNVTVGSVTPIAGPRVTVSPRSADFGHKAVHTRTAFRTVTLTNAGNFTVQVFSVALAGNNAEDFTQQNYCSSLAPGTKCFVNVAFQPTTSGPRSAILAIVDNVSTSPQKVSLAGTGVN